MPDYSKSKIYRVFCGDDEYIGSTTRPLSERMNEHRARFKTKGACRSHLLFEKHGVENCKIELIEDCPCDRKDQLKKREGEIQRERECVNKQISGRTRNEYYLENKDKMDAYRQKWRDENQDRIKENSRLSYLRNIEKVKQRTKTNYQQKKISTTIK